MFSPCTALERTLRLWLVIGLALAASVTRSRGGELAAVSETDASEPTTATPWRVFAVSGASSEVSAGENALRVRLAAGDRASCVREIGPEALRAVVCRFNLSLQGAGADAEQVFRVGSELSTSNADDADVHTFARLGVRGAGDPGAPARGFRLRDLVARRDSPVFQGTQAVTWALNHSGRDISYASPNGTIETVASDHMDVWVGRTKVFDDIAITQSTVPLSDLKWYWGAGAGTTAFDHLQVDALADADVAGVASAPGPDASPAVVAGPGTPEPAAAAAIELYRPSPNPFARTTRFAYAIPGATEAVEIGVYDVAGRQVRNLIREKQSAGRYEVAWDGRNDAGDHVHDGIYFLRASIGTDLRVARIAYLVK